MALKSENVEIEKVMFGLRPVRTIYLGERKMFPICEQSRDNIMMETYGNDDDFPENHHGISINLDDQVNKNTVKRYEVVKNDFKLSEKEREIFNRLADLIFD